MDLFPLLGKIKVMVKVRVALKAIWLFCSYLFVPQWGRSRRVEERNNEIMGMKE